MKLQGFFTFQIFWGLHFSFVLFSVHFYKQVLLPGGTVILFVPSYVACLWIEELENAGLVNQCPGMSSV
jgi:hypothetical protein